MNNQEQTKLHNIKRGDKMYITRIMPTLGIYDLCELTIRTIGENYFVGIDKHDKRARLFSPSDIDSIVFSNRKDALMKIKEAEKHKQKVSEEKYYEEY